MNEDFIDSLFKCPSIRQYADIDIKSVEAYYEKHSEKCMRNINDNRLKTPRPTISRWPKTFPQSDFKEEVNDFITLLSRVKGLPTSNTYYE